MTSHDRLLTKILKGTSDADIGFASLCNVLVKLGFQQRIRGSHHIFTRGDIEEILNLQPEGSKAKPYQVKQIRNLLLRYRFILEGGHEH